MSQLRLYSVSSDMAWPNMSTVPIGKVEMGPLTLEMKRMTLETGPKWLWEMGHMILEMYHMTLEMEHMTLEMDHMTLDTDHMTLYRWVGQETVSALVCGPSRMLLTTRVDNTYADPIKLG